MSLQSTPSHVGLNANLSLPATIRPPHLTGLQRLLAIQPDQTTGYGL